MASSGACVKLRRQLRGLVSMRLRGWISAGSLICSPQLRQERSTVQRTGASRFARRQIERHRRLASVADLCVRQTQTMDNNELAELWSGSYSYDNAPHTPNWPPVAFRLRLTMGWFGGLKGVIEDGDGGIPEPARIRGRVTGLQVSFKKRYPRSWGRDQTGKTTLLSESRSQTVFYSGTFTPDRRAVSGRWWIEAARNRFINGIEYEFPETTGTWSAAAGA